MVVDPILRFTCFVGANRDTKPLLSVPDDNAEISLDNTIKQRWMNKSSLSWYDEPLSAMNYSVLDSSRVALLAG